MNSTVASFEQSLMSPQAGGEQWFDLDRESRMQELVEEYNKRSGINESQPDRALSPQYVVQQAAMRYFAMVSGAMWQLNDLFTEEEMSIVLTCTNSPVLTWRYGSSFANFVADEFGIESLDELEDGSTLKVLMLKLLELNAAQGLAMLDLCERYWRNPQSGSLSEVCEALGMKLAEEA